MIALKDLRKFYKSGEAGIMALDGVSIDIKEREFVAFKGPSGSGKTTLLNILGTLDTPTSGNYFFEGEDICTFNARARILFRRKTLGFIFQNFNLIPELNVYENVEIPLLITKEGIDKGRILEAIEAVGLSKHIKHRPSQLSGGQQQRVSIARAIVKRPKLILADEPTANLDSKTGMEIINLIAGLRENFGSTVVFCTHDAQVMRRADRTVHLVDGRIENQSP